MKRALSVVSLTAFGIGSIIGTGIFVLTGTAAANHTGPALALSSQGWPERTTDGEIVLLP